MAFIYKYVNGTFWVKKDADPYARYEIPSGSQARPVAQVFAVHETNGTPVPVLATPDGKIHTTATLTGTVTIADVVIQDKIHPEIDLSVVPPGGLASLVLGSFAPLAKKEDGTLDLLKINDSGALFIDDSIMNKMNMTSDISYVSSGNGAGEVYRIEEYPTGSSGAKKRTEFTYNSDDKVTKIEVTTI